MSTWGARAAGVLALVGLVTLAPPLRITPLGSKPPRTDSEQLAPQLAASLWREVIVPTARDSEEVAALTSALSTDPEAALKRSGRQHGIGRGALFYTRGEGRVVSIEKRSFTVEAGETRVLLLRGPYFGTTLRDAAGPREPAAALSPQVANETASELNRLAVEATSRPFESLALGDTVRFAGVARVVNLGSFKPPLEVLPVEVAKP